MDPVKIIHAQPMLTNAIAVELLVSWQRYGDVKARDRVVCAYMRLCTKLAAGYQGARNQDFMEVVNESAIGLMKACDRFDTTGRMHFSTYASWWIKAYILLYLRTRSRVRIHNNTRAGRALYWSCSRAERAIWNRGEQITAASIAHETGLSLADVESCIGQVRGYSVSLHDPVGRASQTWEETLAAEGPTAEDNVIAFSQAARVREALVELEETLSAREREILRRRLLADDPLTLKALGDRFGLTRERVRQIEAKVRIRVRECLRPLRAAEARAAA